MPEYRMNRSEEDNYAATGSITITDNKRYNEANTGGCCAPKINQINYDFNEAALIGEFKAYIDSTYDPSYHYAGKIQAMSVVNEAGHGASFAMGNIIKYAMRYGKKQGYNRKDIMKIMHYALLALHAHDQEHKNKD